MAEQFLIVRSASIIKYGQNPRILMLGVATLQQYENLCSQLSLLLVFCRFTITFNQFLEDYCEEGRLVVVACGFCVGNVLGPFHTYLSTRWWTKLFVHLIVQLDVEGNCHVIIGFVCLMNGFTHGSGRHVELDL